MIYRGKLPARNPTKRKNNKLLNLQRNPSNYKARGGCYGDASAGQGRSWSSAETTSGGLLRVNLVIPLPLLMGGEWPPVPKGKDCYFLPCDRRSLIMVLGSLPQRPMFTLVWRNFQRGNSTQFGQVSLIPNPPAAPTEGPYGPGHPAEQKQTHSSLSSAASTRKKKNNNNQQQRRVPLQGCTTYPQRRVC